MNLIFIFIIKFYKRLISPVVVSLFGHSCRFSPTCSEYALEAYSKFNFFKATKLTIKRLLRCHPFSKHFGVDPVPNI